MDESGTPSELLRDVLEQQRQQTAAMSRLVTTAERVARDFYTSLSGTMKVVLVYPWAHDLRVVRAVLTQSAEEERQLQESLDKYDQTDKTVTAEDWLKKEGFRLMATKQIQLGRQHVETFAAAAGAHRGLGAPSPSAPTSRHGAFDPEAPLELELQRPGES